MVQNLEQVQAAGEFPASAPTANPVFFRTYSRRRPDQTRETWGQVCDRTIRDIGELGSFTPEEEALLDRMQRQLKALVSGRALWVMGTHWIHNPENFSGAYNCTSTNVVDWRAFGLMMDLAMMGCGTGAVLEPQYVEKLPMIRNVLHVSMQGDIGTVPVRERQEETQVQISEQEVFIQVGDSRRGWVKSYQSLLELSSDERFNGAVNVRVDLSHVRPAGEPLKGFGGVANPIKLPILYERCTRILNPAVGRQLSSVECCLLIDEAAVTIVAGNIRRCLPAEALVHTENGLICIKDIQIGDRVQTPIGYRRVTDKFDQGHQDVYDIETDATYPQATLNHRQAVVAVGSSVRWVALAQIESGDRLIHNADVLPGILTELPPDSVVEVPSLTANNAWFLGFTQGCGANREVLDEVSWPTSAPTTELQFQLSQRLIQALTQEWGLPIQSLGATIRCAVPRLGEYLNRILPPTQVPPFILQAPPSIRAAYLAGLMDGQLDPSSYLLSTKSVSFLRQVGVLLSSLGILSRRSIDKGSVGTMPRYVLTVSKTAPAYSQFIAPHSVLSPAYVLVGASQVEGSLELDSSLQSQPAVISSFGLAVEVKGLGGYDHVQTYDIEVEEAHCFYCDGYLTHNSAGMRQGSSEDPAFAVAKDNLWQQGPDGNWRIDPARDALRMANHTRVFHTKPSAEECVEAVRKQFYSGEGAIQWAGEAIARSNRDLVPEGEAKRQFIQAYTSGQGAEWLQEKDPHLSEVELVDRLSRYGLNPCGEIIGSDYHCNLSEVHLNQLDPSDFQEQDDAFTAGALSVAALLNHCFQEPRYRQSREMDPIVGVSFTGLFDFFVHAFGVEWLRWWEAGRPDTPEGLLFKAQEREYLTRWRNRVHSVVWEYCDRHGLKRPNRCTTVQPAGTKSLLTGASPGWHPPKAQRYIRRITFGKNDPVARACIDFGYSVVPSQSDKDENGNLLTDPFDSRCTEWLVELPVEVPWANLPGASEIEIEKFSALAQFDFYMQVQSFYTTHNTSATIELREDEVEALGARIHQAIMQDEGYISAALLARFDAPFPRLPFEKIDEPTYIRLRAEVQARKQTDDFLGALLKYDQGILVGGEGPAGCDSMGCLMPESTPTL